MERFVRLTAPTNAFDFVFKLGIFMLIGGGLNHLRHVLTHGFPGNKSFWLNFSDASFTTLPMCTFALLLIGHLNSLQKRLYLQANQDSLTGLPNRRWFMTKTPDTLLSPCAMLIVDIDHFKHINDRLGHDMGDTCLVEMAQHLAATLPPPYRFARIGGEEFAALITITDDATLREIGNKLADGIHLDQGANPPLHVTNSIGIAICNTPQSRTRALRNADHAVYQAKAQGRARYILAPSESERAPLKHSATVT